nr:DNA helicase [Tanacetum cinerariifolium]
MLNTSRPFANSGCHQISPKADMLDKTFEYGLYASANANNNVNEIEMFGVGDYKNQDHLEMEHPIDKAVGTNVALPFGNTIAKVGPCNSYFTTENANANGDGIQQLSLQGYTYEYQPCKDEPIHKPLGTNNGLSTENKKLQVTAANVNTIDPYRLQVCDILGMGQRKRKRTFAKSQYESKRIHNSPKQMICENTYFQRQQLSKDEPESLSSTIRVSQQPSNKDEHRRLFLRRQPKTRHLQHNYLNRQTGTTRQEGHSPRFLQLYIYDTTNEVKNRMSYFNDQHEPKLKKEIVEGLIEFLDTHNALVQLFRTARNKYIEADIPEFKVRLYNVIGTRQYELPTAETIGAIVFTDSSAIENEFDLIIEELSQFPQRVSKLHTCYMSLQFPLLFVYGENGYQKDMKLANIPGQCTKANKRMSMNMYYSYDRLNHYNLPLLGGKLFQQYVVTAYCAIEQSRLDYIKQKRDNIRSEYLSCIYDAILRGDHDGSDLGLHIVLTASFTGSPRYMYAHYLDTLAICRVHGSPSFFITFTCNTKCPEIEQFIKPFPQLTTADRADIVDRIFEKKVRDYIDFVRGSNNFGNVTGELPNPATDANTYAVISELTVHGPRGSANPAAACMKDGGNCNRNFPKPCCDKTNIDKDGFVHYRQRDTKIQVQR